MKYTEVVADAGSADTVLAIAPGHAAANFRLNVVSEDSL